MWIPETPLRDDGPNLIEALARESPEGKAPLDVRQALRAILGARSIAAGLLKIPIPIVNSVADQLPSRPLSLPGLSASIASLARDLAHSSVNSVHFLYALLHSAPEECDDFLRNCDRLMLAAGHASCEKDMAFLERLEKSGDLEAVARYQRIVGRHVVSPPFVDLILTRYLTSVWYPYDPKRFDNYRTLVDRHLVGEESRGVEMDAFSLTIQHAWTERL